MLLQLFRWVCHWRIAIHVEDVGVVLKFPDVQEPLEGFNPLVFLTEEVDDSVSVLVPRFGDFGG